MKTKQPLAKSKVKQPTAAQLAGGLAISVGEARKILGADAKGYDDQELVTLIYQLSEVAQALLKIPLSSDEKLL